MDNPHRRSVLQQEITNILAHRSGSSPHPGASEQAHSVITRSLVCGSIALLALNPAPVYAVGLGEIRLGSALGEPLRATVPVQLGKGEQFAPGCIGLAPRSAGDLTELRNTRFQIDPATGPGVFQLRLSTNSPLREPMYALNLQVDCPGLPVVQRQYVVMLDLPGLNLAAPTAARPLPAGRRPVSAPPRNAVSRPRPATTRRLQHSADPIPAGSAYRVREGDTLSTIAARIEGRPADFTWPLAGLIFRTNPRAFVRGNPDLIKLGWVIQIPEPAEWARLTPVQGPTRLAAAPPAAQMSKPAKPVPVVPPMQTPAALTSQQLTSAETQQIQPDTEAQRALPAAKPQPAAETDSPFADEQSRTGQTADASSTEANTTPAATTTNTEPATAGNTETGSIRTETEASSASVTNPAAQMLPAETSERTAATTVNPLLAVLFGILIGLGLSALLLRRRLIDGALALLSSRRRETNFSERTNPANENLNLDETGDWLPTGAIEAAAIPVGQPAEQTYVVEVSDDTSVDDPFNPDAASIAMDATQDTAEEIATPLTGDDIEIDEDSSETVLAELFDEDLAALPAETDLPEEVFMTDDDDCPTALAPTAELPHFNDSIPGADDVTAELEGLDQEDIETSELDLTSLSQTADDTKLSSTLKEALSLLEQDYQDELTASQVIDQDAISKALEGDNPKTAGHQKD